MWRATRKQAGSISKDHDLSPYFHREHMHFILHIPTSVPNPGTVTTVGGRLFTVGSSCLCNVGCLAASRCLPGASRNPLPSCDNWRCLQIATTVPWGRRVPSWSIRVSWKSLIKTFSKPVTRDSASKGPLHMLSAVWSVSITWQYTIFSFVHQFIYFLVLGIEPRASTLSCIPTPFYFETGSCWVV